MSGVEGRCGLCGQPWSQECIELSCEPPSVPTEQADGGAMAWRWRWKAGMYAHNSSGPGRWYYEDSQPSSATDHHKDIQPLYAAPLATPIAGDVLTLDRWGILEQLAKAASVGFDKTLLAVRDVVDVVDRDFIAAANPAAILELIAAARHQPNREG